MLPVLTIWDRGGYIEDDLNSTSHGIELSSTSYAKETEMKNVLLILLTMSVVFLSTAAFADSLTYNQHESVSIIPDRHGESLQTVYGTTFRAGPSNCKVAAILRGTTDGASSGSDYEFLRGHVQVRTGSWSTELTLYEHDYPTCPGGNYPCNHTVYGSFTNVDLRGDLFGSPRLQISDAGIGSGDGIFWDQGTYEMTAWGSWSLPGPQGGNP
jgi:hypothetical protein